MSQDPRWELPPVGIMWTMSTTETAPIQSSTTTYSALEAALLAGISYRMIDHWLRVGTIRLERDNTPGSGHPRRFTSAEVDRLCTVVQLWRAAEEVVNEFRSGRLWERSALTFDPSGRDGQRVPRRGARPAAGAAS